MAAAVMTRPRIGVTTSRGGGRYMWWFYWMSLTLYGAEPVRLIAPARQYDFTDFDGFIIGGGDDISPDLYLANTPLDARLDPERDQMELEILSYADPLDMPVLGICRGAQMLNIHRGGSLHQDVRAVFEGVPKMWTPLPAKTVEFVNDSRLARIHERETLRVNSLHNQAIDRLGDRLNIVARDEYEVPQAIEDPDAHFAMGVQWHPEFLIYRRIHRRLFKAFLTAVRNRL